MNGEREAKLVKGRVRPTLLRLAGPMMLALVSMIAFNLVDAMYIGRIGSRELAAIGFTFPVVFFLTAIAIGVGTGATSVISRAIGANKTEGVKKLTTHTLIFGIILSVTMAVSGLLTIGPVFSMLGADPGMIRLIRSYMVVWYFGMPFVIVPMLGNSIIRATGDMKTPMFIMLFAVFVNLILDPILIFGIGPFPELGLQGAAWATAVARALTMLMAAYILRHREDLITFEKVGLKEVLGSWGKVLYIGVPAAFINVLAPINTGMITAVMATHGELAVGGFGAASRVEALLIMPQIALGVAMIPFIGQNLGAGRMDRVRKAVDISFKMMVVYGLAAFAFMALTAPLTARIFNSDPAVTDSYISYLRIGGLGFFLLGMALFVGSSFNGLGKPFPAAALNFTRLLVIMVPLVLIGSDLFGVDGIYLGMAISNIIVGVMAYYWLRRTLWGRLKPIIPGRKVVLPDCHVENLGSRVLTGPRECR